jgi:hypothetical protein
VRSAATNAVEQHLLDRVKLHLSHRFTNESVEATTYLDQMLDAVVLEFRKEVWEDKVAESTYEYRVPIPDTWVQHLRKRLGLSHRTRDLRGSVTLCKRVRFPDAPVNYPDRLGPPVLVETAAETWLEPRL